MNDVVKQWKELGNKLQVNNPLSLMELDVIMEQMRSLYQKLAMQREMLLIHPELASDPAMSSDAVPKMKAPSSNQDDAAQIADRVDERIIDQKGSEPEIVETIQPLNTKVELDPEELLKERDNNPPPIHPEIPADNVFIVEKELKDGADRNFLEVLGISKKKATPPRDVRDYISINERLYFINVLFSGSHERYNAAMDEVNLQENAEAAEEILNALIDAASDELQDEQQPALELLRNNIRRMFTAV